MIENYHETKFYQYNDFGSLNRIKVVKEDGIVDEIIDCKMTGPYNIEMWFNQEQSLTFREINEFWNIKCEIYPAHGDTVNYLYDCQNRLISRKTYNNEDGYKWVVNYIYDDNDNCIAEILLDYRNRLNSATTYDIVKIDEWGN